MPRERHIKARYKLGKETIEIRIAPDYCYWVYVRLKCGGWRLFDIRDFIEPAHIMWVRKLRLECRAQDAIDFLATTLKDKSVDPRPKSVEVY
jgi:hypothetical protein